MLPTSREHLHRYRLFKSFLLPGTKGKNIHDIILRSVAFPAVDYDAACVGIVNRLRSCLKNSLHEYLRTPGNAGRLQGMRRGTFIIPAGNFELVFAATSRVKDQRIKQNLVKWSVTEEEYGMLARKIISALEGPDKSYKQLRKTLPRECVRDVEIKHGKTILSNTTFDITLMTLMDRWQVIYSPATWKTGDTRYCLFDREHTFRNPVPERRTAEEKFAELYLKQYGPVSIEDIAWWCEFTTNRVRNIIAALDHDIATIDLQGTPYLIAREELPSFTEFEPEPFETCHLLGGNDPFMMGYSPEHHSFRKKYANELFQRTGETHPAVLVEGEPAGTWQVEETKASLSFTVTLFHKLKEKQQNRLCTAIDRTAEFLGSEDKECTVELRYP